MKTVEEINARIKEYLSDDRLKGPPVNVQINAPLALIQCSLEGCISGLRWVLEDSELGPTGDFPEGQLTPEDEGGFAFAVYEHEGKVVVNFNSPVHWLGMGKDQAREFGELLIKHSNS